MHQTDLHLLTPAEAAETLKVSLATLGRWRKHGLGPEFVRMADRLIRYRQEDVEAWVIGPGLSLPLSNGK